MEDLLRKSLLEGEAVLWSGKAVPFKLLEPPYGKSLCAVWVLSTVWIVGFAALYIPFALNTGIEWNTIVPMLVLADFLPVLLSVRPLLDKRELESKTLYAITNYRVFSITKDQVKSLFLKEETELDIVAESNGCGTVRIGLACKKSPLFLRSHALMGVKDETGKKVAGLAFYHLRAPKETVELIREISGHQTREELKTKKEAA